MKKILLIGETATLTHVGRPFVIANTLQSMGYEVHFACDTYFDHLLPESKIIRHHIHSQSPQTLSKRLTQGLPLFSKSTLKNYIAEDLSLLKAIKPDLVIGDLRLSLSISARLAKIAYVNLLNAQWSPYTTQNYPTPKLPLVKLLGYKIANYLFQSTIPLLIKTHILGINSLRKKYQFNSYPSIEAYYADGDATWYDDIEGLIPLKSKASSLHFIGPVDFEPKCPPPRWLDKIPTNRPLIYFTIGSSGDTSALKVIIEALGEIDATIMFSKSGANIEDRFPSNFLVENYLPAVSVCKIAQLALTNGGSSSTYIAIGAGIPTIGFCNNMDQFKFMHFIEQHQFGRIIRPDQCEKTFIKQCVLEMLSQKQTAVNIQQFLQKHPLESLETRLKYSLKKMEI